MMIFSIFSPKELKERILEIHQVKDQSLVSVSLQYEEETNSDVIIFKKENYNFYESSLLAFGKENATALNISSPIAVDIVEIDGRGEQYLFVEELKNNFASESIYLAKKVLP